MDQVDAVIAANSPGCADHLLVLDAPGLVAEACSRADRVSVWCDDIREAALAAPDLRMAELDAGALTSVDLVWLRLPRALGTLDEYAELIAARASSEVQLVAGGRHKDLNKSMNKVLARHFGEVRASLGMGRARALLAGSPRPGESLTWPRRRVLSLEPRGIGEPLTLWWHGATFAAGRLDDGTRLLVDHLDQVADASHYLDHGCGSGILATLLARAHPEARVDAVDVSWAAVAATRLTAANTRVHSHWAAHLGVLGDDGVDVIVCNPPFHRGTAKDSGPAFGMFAEAARVLRPGGEFWCVFNSHLPWRHHLQRLIGATELVAQDRHYTLTRSVRR